MKNRLFFAVLCVMVGCYSGDSLSSAKKGEVLPPFKLLLPDSTIFSVVKNIPNGKPVIFFYFGPDCPYSQAQMEDIITNINKLSDFIIYVLTGAPFDQMKNFYNHYNLSRYPNIVTGIDSSGLFAQHFKVQIVPHIAIYGEDAKLSAEFSGKITTEQIMTIIN